MADMGSIATVQEASCVAPANHPDFGEPAGPRIDFNRACVLLDNDIVTNGEAKANAFSRLCPLWANSEHGPCAYTLTGRMLSAASITFYRLATRWGSDASRQSEPDT